MVRSSLNSCLFFHAIKTTVMSQWVEQNQNQTEEWEQRTKHWCSCVYWLQLALIPFLQDRGKLLWKDRSSVNSFIWKQVTQKNSWRLFPPLKCKKTQTSVMMSTRERAWLLSWTAARSEATLQVLTSTRCVCVRTWGETDTTQWSAFGTNVFQMLEFDMEKRV